MLNNFEMFSQSINDQVFPLVNVDKKKKTQQSEMC